MSEQSPDRKADAASSGRRTLRRWFDRALWLVVIGLFAWRFGPQLLAAGGVGAGDAPMPALVVTTLDGERIALSSLEGKVVVVNFWATWCAPCRLEMPGLERIHRDLADEGVVLLGLATDIGDEAGVRSFLAERGITYANALAPRGAARAFGGYRGIPTTFLIDRQGRIRHRITGFYAEPALRAALRRLLDSPQAD